MKISDANGTQKQDVDYTHQRQRLMDAQNINSYPKEEVDSRTEMEIHLSNLRSLNENILEKVLSIKDRCGKLKMFDLSSQVCEEKDCVVPSRGIMDDIEYQTQQIGRRCTDLKEIYEHLCKIV